MLSLMERFQSARKVLLFDIETDGLYYACTKFHCGWTMDAKTGDMKGTRSLEDFCAMLDSADVVIGQNIINFDIPTLQKLNTGWTLSKLCEVWDTTVWSRLAYPDIGGHPISLAIPKELRHRHSLESWGYRLGILKGDYGKKQEAWKEYNDEMYEYCKQDVIVTKHLLDHLLGLPMSLDPKDQSFDLEHRVQSIVSRQEKFGVAFDKEAAYKLYASLCARQQELLRDLRTIFPSWQVKEKEFIPKVTNKKHGHIKGELYTKWKTIEFNPNSNKHIVYWLKQRHGWKPNAFTDTGEPKVDEEALKDIEFLPEVPLLLEYKMIQKRLGQIADGDNGWLKKVGSDGLIHGSVNTLGAGTRRMTHSDPNLAQVPRVGNPYGKECRSLFGPPKGFEWLVGCDAQQLELRTLAHFLFSWDQGKYAHAAVSGTKENKDDIHWINAKAMGVSRDEGKTLFYAWSYGAGLEKLGRTKNKGWDQELNIKTGKKIANSLTKNLPALAALKETILRTIKTRGFLVDLDDHAFTLRSQHSCLNELNQRAGAIIMKRALVILDRKLQEFLVPGVDYEFCLNIHDEFQIAVNGDKERADQIGTMAKQAIKDAGKYYNLKCELDGDYAIGKNWAETH